MVEEEDRVVALPLRRPPTGVEAEALEEEEEEEEEERRCRRKMVKVGLRPEPMKMILKVRFFFFLKSKLPKTAAKNKDKNTVYLEHVTCQLYEFKRQLAGGTKKGDKWELAGGINHMKDG